MEIIRCKNLTQKPSGRERRRKKGERRIERRIKRKKEKMTILFHVTKCRI